MEMRTGEWYHSLTVPKNCWIVIRVDGRGFTKLTRDLELEKPFDRVFSTHMERVAKELLLQLDGAIYAYTESDEISVLLPPNFDMFNRSVEKLVSVSAGIASSYLEYDGHFDSRIWVGIDETEVIRYFTWRQEDAARCALNGWVYYTLIKNGATRRSATQQMKTKNRSWKHDVLHEHGINFNDLPRWQRRGLAVYYETFVKDGWNPITHQVVQATRRRVVTNRELPMREDYAEWLHELIQKSSWND